MTYQWPKTRQKMCLGPSSFIVEPEPCSYRLLPLPSSWPLLVHVSSPVIAGGVRTVRKITVSKMKNKKKDIQKSRGLRCRCVSGPVYRRCVFCQWWLWDPFIVVACPSGLTMVLVHGHGRVEVVATFWHVKEAVVVVHVSSCFCWWW